MKVRELMDRSAVSCCLGTTLETAMLTMRRHECDALPVTGHDGGVTLGVVSDRDIAMALALNPRPAHELTVGEVLRPRFVVVAPDDGIAELLRTMAHHRAGRVAVVDANGRLEGMVGIAELLRRVPVSGGRGGDLNAKDVLETLRAIDAPARAHVFPEAAASVAAPTRRERISEGVRTPGPVAPVVEHALPAPVTLG